MPAIAAKSSSPIICWYLKFIFWYSVVCVGPVLFSRLSIKLVLYGKDIFVDDAVFGVFYVCTSNIFLI